MGNGWERLLGSLEDGLAEVRDPAEYGNTDEEIETQGAKALGIQ